MGVKQDLPLGEQLLASFRPFIAHLAASHLSPKTIRTHVANLWLLGGEIIRDLNVSVRPDHVFIHQLLSDAALGPMVGQEGVANAQDPSARRAGEPTVLA